MQIDNNIGSWLFIFQQENNLKNCSATFEKNIKIKEATAHTI